MAEAEKSEIEEETKSSDLDSPAGLFYESRGKPYRFFSLFRGRIIHLDD